MLYRSYHFHASHVLAKAEPMVTGTLYGANCGQTPYVRGKVSEQKLRQRRQRAHILLFQVQQRRNSPAEKTHGFLKADASCGGLGFL